MQETDTQTTSIKKKENEIIKSQKQKPALLQYKG